MKDVVKGSRGRTEVHWRAIGSRVEQYQGRGRGKAQGRDVWGFTWRVWRVMLFGEVKVRLVRREEEEWKGYGEEGRGEEGEVEISWGLLLG